MNRIAHRSLLQSLQGNVSLQPLANPFSVK